MMFLVIIFIPPVYFLVRKKWGGFILNSILYLLAIFTFMFMVGFVFWALAVGHAAWHLRKEHMQEQAKLIAKEIAATQDKRSS